MKNISTADITALVADICEKSNKVLPSSLENCICNCKKSETNEVAKSILSDLKSNMDAARELDIPVCQDTGMAVVFAEIGQDVHIVGGSFEKAVNDEIAKLSKDYKAGTDLSTVSDDSLSVSWEWPFEKATGTAADQDDELDTLLGNNAADDNPDNDPKISITVKTTVTQID